MKYGPAPRSVGMRDRSRGKQLKVYHIGAKRTLGAYNIHVIEKIIWQTHNYRYDDLPNNFKKCIASWKMLNPEWDHRYVDHNEREAFIKSRYPELYEVYEKTYGMYQADIWRVAVVYEFGGVYADMDTFCYMPLEYMLQDKNTNCLITEPKDNKPNKNDHINNAMFAAPMGSRSLKNVIDETIRDINNIDVHSIFSQEALKDYNPFFNAARHGNNYKMLDCLFGNNKINYYGNVMNYKDYLKEIVKLSDDEIKSLI
jgi:mannosyltransferase OCH1-like enzyme